MMSMQRIARHSQTKHDTFFFAVHKPNIFGNADFKVLPITCHCQAVDKGRPPDNASPVKSHHSTGADSISM